MQKLLFFLIFLSNSLLADIPMFWWKEGNFINFGDHLSLKVVERIVGTNVRYYNKRSPMQDRKLLAIGSVLYFANEGDTVWGSGVNGKRPLKSDYNFSKLDVRAVRGPLTRKFLKDNFNIDSPKIFGDPALLVPYLFPEFKKSKYPTHSYIIIPHYLDAKHFQLMKNVVYPTEAWDEIIRKIIDSEFVISGSMHGVILAEAFGIPARLLRISDNEPLLKFEDYYRGTGREKFEFATSVKEALEMGGEHPGKYEVKKLYNAFPFDLWPGHKFYKPQF